MDEKKDAPKIDFIEDLACRESWAETVQVFYGDGPTIRIEFCAYRCTQHPPIHPDRIVPTARVVMPIGLAQTLLQHLKDRLEDLSQKVVLVQATPESPAKN